METMLTFTDSEGDTWELSGRPRTSFPWQCWPDMVGFNTLHEWTMSGVEGSLWGEIMDFVPMQRMTALSTANRSG